MLTPQEIDELMGIGEEFDQGGESIIFITHKLNEIMKVSDCCTVLRRGKIDRNGRNLQNFDSRIMMMGRQGRQFQIERKPRSPRRRFLP